MRLTKVAKPVIYSVLALLAVGLVAFIRYPKIAKVFYFLATVLRVSMSVFPYKGVSPIVNLYSESTPILVEAVFFEVGFLSAAIN